MFNMFKKKQAPVEENYKDKILSGKPKTNEEIATRQVVDAFSILGYIPDPDEILNKNGKTFHVYRKLMYDSQISACVNSRKAGTKSLDWDIDRGRENTPKSDLIKDFYRDNNPLIDTLIDSILMAPAYGFQPIEVIWGRVGEYILPIDMKAKNQEWFQFGVGGELRLLKGNTFTGISLPDRKFLTPTYNDIHNNFYNPYGDRLLARCFWPATFKRTGIKWWVTFTEKYGMPYLIGKVPRGASDNAKEAMKANLENMVLDAIAVIEEGTEVEFESPSKGQAVASSTNTYEGLINQCDSQISKVLLGQTLTTDQGNSNASYALGKVHSTVKRDIVQTDKKLVEKTCNLLNKWIIEVNFGDTNDVPKFSLYLENDVHKEKAERDSLLSTKMGVKFKKNYFIRNYGIDSSDFEINENEGKVFTPRPKDPSEAGKADKKIEKDSKVPSPGDFSEYHTDRVVSMFTDEVLQREIKNTVQPVLKMLKETNSYEEALKVLNEIKPEMDSFSVHEKLTKLLFIGDLLGNADAADNVDPEQ